MAQMKAYYILMKNFHLFVEKEYHVHGVKSLQKFLQYLSSYLERSHSRVDEGRGVNRTDPVELLGDKLGVVPDG